MFILGDSALNLIKKNAEIAFQLNRNSKKRLSLNLELMKAELDGEAIELNPTGIRLPAPVKKLSFQKFKLYPELKTLRIPDYLEKIRINE